MIQFLIPGFLYAAGAVAAGVIALHFLVTEQPKSDVLPTVRFFPDVVARSTSVTLRPSDLWLLLLRVLTILLIGAAFAQPRFTPGHHPVARIVVVDLSRAVGNRTELADSARPYLSGAVAAVVFADQALEVAPSIVADSLDASASGAEAKRARGALTPALIAALRAASRVRESADSVEIVVVSPFVQEEADAATTTVRALLPGALRTVRVAAAPSAAASGVTARAPSIEWADSGATALWAPRAAVDTIGAVRAGDVVLVSPFVRRWRLELGPDSLTDESTRVYARWADGEPAAVERTIGADCIRSLGISMPTTGDVVLRPEFEGFLAALETPCNAAHDFTPLAPAFMAAMQGPDQLAPASALQPRATHMTPLVPWLLAGALVLALLELVVRRRRADSPVVEELSIANTPRTAA
jgi:hypothetical protein